MVERQQAPALVAVALTTLLVGCIERRGIPVDPCTNVTIAEEVTLTNVDEVDLLFMIDDSGSMSEEQASLIDQLPRMVSILASGDFDQDGDGPGDGEIGDPDFDPVRSLQIGVITSDMGSGGYTVGTCTSSDFGDDGILRSEGFTGRAGCDATYPTFMRFEPEMGGSASDFASDVACVATAGTDGCGFEQQLESILKALSPSAPTPWTAPGYAPPTFFRDTFGHGDVANAGFVREDSVLAIIPVTDEEDCSARNPQLFDPAGPFSAGHPNLRCFSNPDQLQPVDRYVQGLLQLRQNPQLLIYAPIAGIPVDLVAEDGAAPRWEALISDDPELRDDRMEERVDPATGDRLLPSCDVTGRGLAYPPIRMLQVARALEAEGVGVTAQSICQSSFEGALTRIIDLVRRALNQSCLPRRLNREADGSVACDVITVLPEADMTCDAMPGAEPRIENGSPVRRDGLPVCVVPQVVPEDRTPGAPAPTEVGWYYDTFTGEATSSCGGQRIAFTVQPPSGSVVRLECYQSVQQTGEGVSVGTFCDPAEQGACEGGDGLTCDPVARTCGVACAADADCRSAGLVGYRCDDRPRSEVDPSQFGGDDAPYGFCVNPTCG